MHDITHLLAAVLGGQSSTTVTTPAGSITTSQSDRDLCIQNAVRLAHQQYPDTRPFGLPLPGTTDTNAGARDRAIHTNIDSMCIGGAGGGGGGFS